MAKGEPHRATQRVIEILQCVSRDTDQGLTLTDLAGMLQAPKSSLFPIVHTLCEMGMLSLNKSTSRYCIGFKAYEIGNVYVQRGGINADIEAEMHDIVAQCGETCLFAQLVGGDVFYLFKVDSTEAVRTVVSPGQRLPAYATGIGKALLSGKTKEEFFLVSGITVDEAIEYGSGMFVGGVTGNAMQRKIAMIAAMGDDFGTGRGWCQAWVRKVYLKATGVASSDCCAKKCRDKWAVKTATIPVGAAIYSSDKYSSSVTCSCGRNAGHVGIYIGNNKVASNVGGIRIESLDSWNRTFGYGGWSWNGVWSAK